MPPLLPSSCCCLSLGWAPALWAPSCFQGPYSSTLHYGRPLGFDPAGSCLGSTHFCVGFTTGPTSFTTFYLVSALNVFSLPLRDETFWVFFSCQNCLALPFSEVLQCLLFSWFSLWKHLTLPALTLANFIKASIWGGPMARVDSQALLPNAAPARALISGGFTKVSQLWNSQSQAWRPPVAFFPSPPSPRILTYY